MKEILSNDTKDKLERNTQPSSKNENNDENQANPNIVVEQSFEQENNIPDQVKMTSKSKFKQRKAFYLSKGLPTQDRVIIFKQDFAEFAALDDEQIRKLIQIYDEKLNSPYIQADPSISTVGGILIWTGWLFMTSAAGYDVVDYDSKHVPQKIAMNIVLAGAGGGIMHQLL